MSAATPPGHNWIGGRRLAGTSGRAWPIVDPASGHTLEEVARAGTADVDAAVRAARAALPQWAGAPPAERTAALNRLASILGERATQLAKTETRQTGKPIRLSSGFDVPAPSTTSPSSRARPARWRGAPRESIRRTTRRGSAASRSASWGRSSPGTTRSRWRDGRSFRPSRPATRSFSNPPTLVTGVGSDVEIARDEVFGPVLVVLLAVSDITGRARKEWHRTVFTHP